MLLVGFLIVLFNTNCATKIPKVTPCTVVNVDVALCVPTDANKREYDIRPSRAIGYTMFSPDDTDAIRKFIKEILLRLEDRVNRIRELEDSRGLQISE